MEQQKEEQINVNLRMGVELLARVDAHADRLRVLAPGASIGRSDAIRSLVISGLDLAEVSKAQA